MVRAEQTEGGGEEVRQWEDGSGRWAVCVASSRVVKAGALPLSDIVA